MAAPFVAGPWSTQRALTHFSRVGRDHALQLAELGPFDADAEAIVRPMWALYERHWRRLCGTRLDPLAAALDHPARLTGAVRVDGGAAIVVVGTGPSLERHLPALARARAGLHLVTSPRGAASLAGHGLVPDLVLVEHVSALDAQFTVNDLAHRPHDHLRQVPLVAADARTPAALLYGVSLDRLFVPDPMPTWGLWPATAVALAVMGNAGAVGLLGVDLGSTDVPDPQQAPLRDLLSLLASCTTVPCYDLGRGGAAKPGWTPVDVESIASARAVPPLRLDARPWRSSAERASHLMAALDRVRPLIQQATETLAVAEAVRDGHGSSSVRTQLDAGLEGLVAARASKSVRVDVQDALGAVCLPRLWRTPIAAHLGTAVWRPAMLACHELVGQDAALRRRVGRAA